MNSALQKCAFLYFSEFLGTGTFFVFCSPNLSGLYVCAKIDILCRGRNPSLKCTV